MSRFFLTLLLTLSACATLVLPEMPKVSLSSIQLVELGLLQQHFEITLRIYNPNDHAIRFKDLAFSLVLNDQPLAEGRSNEEFTLPKLGEQLVTMDSFTTSSNLLSQAVALMKGPPARPMTYKLMGRVKLESGPWVPFTHEGTWESKTPPARERA